jgi:hypothetical protein
MIKALLATSVLCSGCAVLPNAVRMDVGHESHATQHKPFTTNPTNYGRSIEAGMTARWTRGRWSLDVSESYSLQGTDGGPAPHEVFEAKVGYDIWRKP